MDDGGRIRHAQKARRCEWKKEGGERCGSPAMRDSRLCYAHERAASVRPRKLELPPLQGPKDVQRALREVMQAMLNGAIDADTAGKLLYGLQIAAKNL